MSGSAQYGKGFWSAAITPEIMTAGVARGFRGDVSEWPPDAMREILIEGIARGFERWLSEHGKEMLEQLEGVTVHTLGT